MRARRGSVHARLGFGAETVVVASQQGNQGMPHGEQLSDPMQAEVEVVNDGGDTTCGGKKAKNTSTCMVNKKGGKGTATTMQTSQGNLHVAPSAIVIVIADMMQVEAEAAAEGWETIIGPNKSQKRYQTHNRGLSDSEDPLVDHGSKKGKGIVVPITASKCRLLAGSLEGVVTRNMGKRNIDKAPRSGRESPTPPSL